MLNAGIVDQDVDGADLGLDPGHPGLHGIGIADVERASFRLDPDLPQDLHGRLEPSRVTPVEDDARPGIPQASRQRQADPLAGSGDKGEPTGKIEQLE